jgi:hypothetical protein
VNQYIIGNNFINNINYLIKINSTDNNTDIIIEFSSNYQEIKLNFDNSNIIPIDIINGIQKYKINTNTNNTNNKEIILNINNTENILNGNYLFRYYFLKNNDEFEYNFDKSCKKNKINDEDNKADKADICLEFNNFEIYHNEKLVNNSEFIKDIEINNKTNSGIRIKIYGSLFKKEITNNEVNELLNTSAFISSVPSYENNTEIKYTDNNKFKLCFMNMNKTDFIFDLQIKINVIFNEFFFKEDFHVYALPIDLTNELKKENHAKGNYLKQKMILSLFTILIIIVIMVVFIFLYFKMKKRNQNLENKVLSISLSSKNSEELFSDYSQDQKPDPDYDNTFI